MEKLSISSQSLGKRATTAIHLDIDTYLKIEKISFLTGKSKTTIIAEMVSFAIEHTEVDGSGISHDFNVINNQKSESVSSIVQKDTEYYSQKVFVSIVEASKITGLSEFYFRKQIKNGAIPVIKSGNKWLVNIEKLLEKLNVLSEGGAE